MNSLALMSQYQDEYDSAEKLNRQAPKGRLGMLAEQQFDILTSS